MFHKIKFNTVQILGLILSGIGLFFIGFPHSIGTFALRLLSFLIVVMGFYGLLFASLVKSRTTIATSLGILIAGFYAFANPESVLFLLGVVCLVSGANSLYIVFRKQSVKDERSIVSALILILLGVFATINSEAALSTVVLILGIVIVILGVILFSVGNKFKILGKKMDVFYNDSFHAPKRERVVVRIHSEDVEEIDYKEL